MLSLLVTVALAGQLDKEISSIVSIQTNDGGEYDIMGSGSYVRTPRGFGVLTAYHVVNEAELSIRACFTDGKCIQLNKESTWGPAASEAGLDHRDWIVYDVPRQLEHKALKVGKPPELGDEVTTLGYPQQVFRLEYGWVAEVPDDGYIHLSIETINGASGAPVLDKHGKLVSMIVAYENVMLDPFKSIGLYWPYPAFNRTISLVPNLEADDLAIAKIAGPSHTTK